MFYFFMVIFLSERKKDNQTKKWYMKHHIKRYEKKVKKKMKKSLGYIVTGKLGTAF